MTNEVQREVAAAPSRAWAERLGVVEEALVRAGRDDLVREGITAAKALLPALDEGDRSGQAMQCLRELMRGIRSCAVQPGATIDETILSKARSFAPEEPRPPKADASGTFPTAALGWAIDAQARDEDASEEDAGDADDLLAGFGAASDDDLDAIIDAVEVPDLAPKSKAEDRIGTLREPLESMRGTPGSESRILMKGELHDGLLSDLIQLFSQNHETGRLCIEGQGRTASLYFSDGAITDAQCDEAVGEEGFYHLMQIEEGRFTYQRGAQSQTQRIFRSAQHLIMDTLRMLDEAQ